MLKRVSKRCVLRFTVFGAACSIVGFAAPAFGGSYLDRATSLVHIANQELGYLGRKLYDGELARLLHAVAAARLDAANATEVPKEVTQAHPHLLLFLQNCERAANAAVERKPKDFVKFVSLAREEEQLFRTVLKQLGWTLPDFKALNVVSARRARLAESDRTRRVARAADV
jgi:hypothetical protein